MALNLFEMVQVILRQQGFLRDILKRFGMSDCKPATTPLVVYVKLTEQEQDDAPEDGKFPSQ